MIKKLAQDRVLFPFIALTNSAVAVLMFLSGGFIAELLGSLFIGFTVYLVYHLITTLEDYRDIAEDANDLNGRAINLSSESVDRLNQALQENTRLRQQIFQLELDIDQLMDMEQADADAK